MAGKRAAARSAVAIVAFTVGCGIALAFSWSHLAPVMTRYRMIPSLLQAAESNALQFACRDNECVSCLQGVRDTPNAIIFTGGSSFRYAIDFTVFDKAMPKPVVNCVRNDSRADAYSTFFSYAHFNQPGQLMLHGYNSWAVNSPGTWAGDQSASFFVKPPSADSAPPKPSLLPPAIADAVRRFVGLRVRETQLEDRVDLALLYARIFLSREMTESPIQWRLGWRVKYPWYRSAELSYWPLSKAEHQKRRLALMRRWFSQSAYAGSFMMGVEQLRPAEEIAQRHERFIKSVLPTQRIVFFPAPELKAAFPERVKKVMAESKTILLQTLAKYPSVQHVEVDYDACGVVDTDFWQEGAMFFDIPHANPDAMPKLTQCVINALARAGIGTAAAAP